MKVYLGGKVSGLEPHEFHAKFEKCREEIRGHVPEDCEILIPVDLCNDDWDWDTCMNVCLQHLKECDLLVLMNDWVDSRGAKEEHAFAKQNNIPIWYI